MTSSENKWHLEEILIPITSISQKTTHLCRVNDANSCLGKKECKEAQVTSFNCQYLANMFFQDLFIEV